jgi:hypothetical protein
MKELPADFVATTDPMSEGLSKQCDAALELLDSKGYEVRVGLTPDYANQITAMSKQPSIAEYCPDDRTKRFRDQAATKQWLSKKRGVFLLIRKGDERDNLAGYGWIGLAEDEHAPGSKTTFAVRIGETSQGQGLAEPFSRVIIYGGCKLWDLKDVWLATWASNGGAVHVYRKIGFKDIDLVPAKRLARDSNEVDDQRIYMDISNEALAAD